METSHCLRHWKNSYVIISRLIFFMYVLGGTLFCAGFLLSLYVFQACKVGVQNYCSTSFKITGPSLAVLGLASIVLAKSKARLEATRRPLPDGQVDPDRFFLFGESRQFFQCLIFGVLIVTCGILVSILGSWIPGCKETFPDQNVTGTSSHTRTCGLLSMQILGPLIILIGLGSFVMGHIKRKRQNHEEPVIDEEPQAPADGRFHVTVGDTVIIFPSPPPPYFEDPLAPVVGSDGATLPRSENPPAYSSIYNIRTYQNDGGNIAGQDCTVYTIPLPSYSNESYSNVYFESDPPPKYEEKDSALPEPSTSPPVTPRDSSNPNPAESSSNPVPEDT
ncbi:transmembrane protein 171 isoform X1 [Bufo bufo]|uniref:transmembrane protein 171 isoform X1 n=1 Tax=Bufo bufo TaxID=8384 RepID=UPI001ABEDA5C|nr:transmembrane protein 171 isoform X1 [Bufo bufo]XP_040277397.1 transmembrane protein 171 isoform X1 [Bufo bufo]XP_040277399.1 transmembrane protein 171 isoform X1 [Bufo bufo]